MEYKIARLGGNDVSLFRQLIQLFIEVFGEQVSEPAPESYLQNLLSNPGFNAFVITHENKVVGGLTAFELPLYYGEYSELYIYDIAIESAHQRKGLGKQLIDSLKQYCLQKGIRVMFVEALEEDINAVEFYRSTGAAELKVRHFEYYLSQIG